VAGGIRQGNNPDDRVANAPGAIVSPDVKAVSHSINQFAFQLYQNLDEQHGNRFFSPASISMALAMAYSGAAGETRRQMADVLHFDLPESRMQNGLGALNGILNASSPAYRLKLANRLWVQSGFDFQPTFLQMHRERLRAEPGEVDFAQAEQARQTMNHWVLDQTEGKIVDLIPPGVLPTDTRLVVTNAVYFKGTWKYQFAKAGTTEAPFHLSKDQEIKVPTMQQTGGLRYVKVDETQLLELPYAGGQLSMLVLLPTRIDGLPELENKLTADRVEQWIAALHHEDEVEVYLPKFTFTARTGLKEVLSTVGMPLAFSNDADFSGITTQKAQKLFDVLHQAYVDVNEEGTEAAAATGVMFSDAPGPVPHVVVFRADHPFLFLIRDNRTGVILFLGRVVNPQA